MSARDRSADGRECGGDVAAYALGALDQAEVEAFREHLESCAVCRDELAAFLSVVDVLPMGAAQYPVPKRLRRRVLAGVAAEPASHAQMQAGRARRPSLLARLSTPRPALALGAAVAIIAVAVGALELGTSGAPRTRVFAAQVTGSPGSAEITLTGGHAELIVHRLPPPPAGQIYEVWLRRANHPPSPTRVLFSTTAKGDADVEVPGTLRGIDQVMVTPEPAGGSRVPTHPAVILAKLT